MSVIPMSRLSLRDYADCLEYVHAMRLFKDEPKWTPLNRGPELDKNAHRKEYVGEYLS